ncbi:hypothetical protein TNIN_151811 [Trichonephila inaurata madagascariensis]|uniref:Uncharacterized protein n=1 Tax=Trichonephila inaurata madagascariensis TaxID=2747483 RepID=A0A8X6WL42_9ARAC|nr:hypothetical protein TNIN_151811 [Trichonephila inaurata madagascariensis]
MGPCFQVPFLAEEREQAGFCPFALSQVSVPAEPALGHLRCHLTDVPPQTNCLPDTVFGVPRTALSRCFKARLKQFFRLEKILEHHRMSPKAIKVLSILSIHRF